MIFLPTFGTPIFTYVNIYNFMKFDSKNTCFFIFLFISTLSLAQKPAAPTNLKASYQKFPDRIELEWKTTVNNHQYKIYRGEKGKKPPVLIDSVNQNRYVDRKGLRVNIPYIYRVRTISPQGLVSDMSNEDTGALLLVASEKDSAALPKQQLKDCIDINLIESKFMSQNFILKFLVANKCSSLKTVQLTLFRSDDIVLDSTDNFLSEKTLDLARNRDSFTAKNNGEPKTGYLILKVATNEDSFTVVRKIE
jgi:hypothetical protein